MCSSHYTVNATSALETTVFPAHSIVSYSGSLFNRGLATSMKLVSCASLQHSSLFTQHRPASIMWQNVLKQSCMSDEAGLRVLGLQQENKSGHVEETRTELVLVIILP